LQNCDLSPCCTPLTFSPRGRRTRGIGGPDPVCYGFSKGDLTCQGPVLVSIQGMQTAVAGQVVLKRVYCLPPLHLHASQFSGKAILTYPLLTPTAEQHQTGRNAGQYCISKNGRGLLEGGNALPQGGNALPWHGNPQRQNAPAHSFVRNMPPACGNRPPQGAGPLLKHGNARLLGG